MELKQYADLTIRGKREHLSQFIKKLYASLDDGWSQNEEREKLGQSFNETWYAFSCTRESSIGRHAATLYLVERNGELYVSNIVPSDISELDYDQYNIILSDFYNRYVMPIADELGVKAEITDATWNIQDDLKSEAYKKLTSFSKRANKRTGSSHPLDRRRWLDFLMALHLDGWPISAGELKRWLVEAENWPDDEAWDLAVQFEFARDLLTAYDMCGK